MSRTLRSNFSQNKTGLSIQSKPHRVGRNAFILESDSDDEDYESNDDRKHVADASQVTRKSNGAKDSTVVSDNASDTDEQNLKLLTAFGIEKHKNQQQELEKFRNENSQLQQQLRDLQSQLNKTRVETKSQGTQTNIITLRSDEEQLKTPSSTSPRPVKRTKQDANLHASASVQQAEQSTAQIPQQKFQPFTHELPQQFISPETSAPTQTTLYSFYPMVPMHPHLNHWIPSPSFCFGFGYGGYSVPMAYPTNSVHLSTSAGQYERQNEGNQMDADTEASNPVVIGTSDPQE